MVFPGRFSTGCSRCRQRKVKCDEGKPSCRRCQTYGKECPGYTDQFRFRHSLTSSSFEKTPSPKLEVQSDPESAQSAEASPVSEASTQDVEQDVEQNVEQNAKQISTHTHKRVQSLPMTRYPQSSYDQLSLCYFLRRFVSPNGTDNFPGHLTFLPYLYDYDNHGLLETATMSVASMAAYNKFGADEFKMKSYKEYGETIRMIQEIITDQSKVTDDKVIAAVLLLCTLKDISGESPNNMNEHATGLFYLLERRGLEQLATNRGTELYLLSLLRLQTYSFISDDGGIYTDPGGITSLLAPYNPLFRGMYMMSKTMALRKSIFHSDSEVRQQALESCFTTLEEFDYWDLEAASYWQSIFHRRGVPTILGQVAAGASFYDAETACIIVLLRTARLTLLVSMLQYYAMVLAGEINEHFTTQGDRVAWENCSSLLKADVKKCIDDILASVPYALGDVDMHGQPTSIMYDGAAGIIILHSIRWLTFCSYASPEQMKKAEKILDRMNAGIGIRSAVGIDANQAPQIWAGSPCSLI